MKKEKISVIIPIYNVEKYLRKCVNSVIKQTYDNLEIILVDDGSLDGCPKICDEFEKIDSRIKVIHKENGGLSNARNLGILKASGEYIMLVDGDDYIAPEMAGIMLGRMKNDDTDLVICSYKNVDEKGNNISENIEQVYKLKDEIINSNKLLQRISFNVSGHWFYSNPCNKLYKSEIFQKIKYPDNYLFEDEFVAHHIFGSIDKASIIKDDFYMHTERADSITHLYDYRALERIDVVLALMDRYKFFKEYGYNIYAKDTADSLYNEFTKIVRYAFKSNADYMKYFGMMMRIVLILICEHNMKGIKLPLVYFKNWIKLCFRRSKK